MSDTLREQVARKMSRLYWSNRGEEITEEMEDEFWLSFAKDADAILALVAEDRARLVDALEKTIGPLESNGCYLTAGLVRAALAGVKGETP